MGSRRKPAFVDGIRTNRTGRRTYAPEFKRKVVEACAVPGDLAGWGRPGARHQREPGPTVGRARPWPAVEFCAEDAGPLLPVTVIPTEVAVDLLREKRPSASAGTIELEIYRARLRLRGEVDADALRSVLTVLAQR